MRRNPINSAISVAVFAFLYLPIATVIIGSFNNTAHGVRWHGFTWKWYSVLWNDKQASAALWNTIVLALASASISTCLGTMLGYALSRNSFPGKALLARMLYLPLCLPDIVMAVALLLFFFLARKVTGWFELSLGTMIVAHVSFQIPFVAMVVKARLQGLDMALEEAAHDLGASPFQRFAHVTLPLMRPGMIAGGMLALTLSLDDFVISFFTSGAGSTTLPILIYSSVKRGITPEINALSTIIIIASVLATITVTVIQRKYAEKTA